MGYKLSSLKMRKATRYKAQLSPGQPASEPCCLPGAEPGRAHGLPCSVAVLPMLVLSF